MVLLCAACAESPKAPEIDASALPRSEAGLILETVGSRTALAEAGLEVGDLVLGWRASSESDGTSAEGVFDSPFDWQVVFQNHADRGPLLLVGERDGETRIWRVERGLWQAKVRPHLPPERLLFFEQGREKARLGELESVAELWDRAFDGLPAAVRLWGLMQRAEAEVRAGLRDQAEATFARALDQAEDFEVAILVRLSLADQLWRGGEYEAAFAALDVSVAQLDERGESLLLAWHLGRLGLITWLRSDLEEAAHYHQRALDITRRLAPGGLRMAASLNNLGLVAVDRRDFEAARVYQQEAWEIRQQLAPGTLREADSLNNLGIIAWEIDDRTSARDFFGRALAIYERDAPGSRWIGLVLNNLGLLSHEEKDYEQAVDFFERSLESHSGDPDPNFGISTRYNLARVEFDRGNTQRALELNHQALEKISQRYPETVLEAKALLLQAKLHRESNPRLALELAERSNIAAEAQVAKVGGGAETRGRFRADRGEAYQTAIALRLAFGEKEAAFNLLERYRARSFLELLVEGTRPDDHEVPEVYATRLAQLDAEHEALLRRLALLDPRKQRQEIEKVQAGLVRWRVDRADLRDEIRRSSSTFAAIHKVAPFDLRDAQAMLGSIGAKVALVSYSVGVDELHLFVLNSEGALTTATIAVGREELEREIQSWRRDIAAASPSTALEERARWLYTQLLAPVEGAIEKAQKLLLIPDGPLHLLPFGALVRTGEERQFLVEWKPFHVTLSATSYGELRRARPNENSGSDGFETQLVAFGDPRFADLQAAPEEVGDRRLRSAMTRGVFRWQELPATRFEVERIASLFPPSSRRIFLAEEATEEQIKNLGELRPRIVHLAAHAFVDERSPLDSALVLSIPQGLPADRDNGLLQVWEILEKVKLDAELVVLSACETGLGELRGGEGLIGLTRAFQIAGARSVLASLWEIEDRVTAEFMTLFYRRLQEGASKDEALQAAQLTLLEHPIRIETASGVQHREASSPYFWAGFQLYGSWR